MPAIEEFACGISISALDSWDKRIQWYATLISEQDYLAPEIAGKAQTLRAGAWSCKEKIKRHYELGPHEDTLSRH